MVAAIVPELNILTGFSLGAAAMIFTYRSTSVLPAQVIGHSYLFLLV